MAREKTAGGYVSAYCTKCRLELGHTIIAKAGDKIVRVKCRTCGSEHNFRTRPVPKGVKKAVSKPPVKAVSAKSHTKRWETAMEKATATPIPYDGGRTYRVGDLVEHSLFGKGIVLKTVPGKMTLLFDEKERILLTRAR